MEQADLLDGTVSLRRVAVIDVGSNSVRLVIFDGVARSPAYFFSEKVLCGLGADLAKTGRLSPQGRVRAQAALRRFTALSRRAGSSVLMVVATAAMREATDGPEFKAELAAEFGSDVTIASGSGEAR